MSRVEPHPESGGGVTAGIRTFFITDIRGYTRFGQERGDEAAARLADAFAGIVGEAVAAFGGEVVEVRGDEVLAVFASPRRAIRAAVELQAALADEVAADPSLPLVAGVGLDAGEAVSVGAGGFRGRALNLAARLCSRAAGGEVLASAEVVHLAGTVDGVGYRGVGAVEVKGVAHPVEVIAIVGSARAPVATCEPLATVARPDLAAELDPLTPLFGRDRELGVLRWWWRRARRGRGRSGFIAGDSGMGKTRLVAEVARQVHAHGWAVMYAPGAGPATDCLEVLNQAQSAQQPTLVIVDDLDMCGGTTLDTVERVLADVAARPMLVVGTYRESSPLVDRLLARGDPAGVHRLSLGPIDGAAAQQIAGLYLRGAETPAPSATLLTSTNGVPALVHHLVGEWVTAHAARRLDSAVSAAAADRPRLRGTVAELATNVVDLESARERMRLYTTEVVNAPVVCPFNPAVDRGSTRCGSSNRWMTFPHRLPATLSARPSCARSCSPMCVGIPVTPASMAMRRLHCSPRNSPRSSGTSSPSFTATCSSCAVTKPCRCSSPRVRRSGRRWSCSAACVSTATAKQGSRWGSGWDRLGRGGADRGRRQGTGEDPDPVVVDRGAPDHFRILRVESASSADRRPGRPRLWLPRQE
jgi:class 3 adenylate cyclase